MILKTICHCNFLSYSFCRIFIDRLGADVAGGPVEDDRRRLEEGEVAGPHH